MKEITRDEFSTLTIKERKKFTGIINWPDGTQYYMQYYKLHRVDGPAVIRSDGTQEYIQNGKYHREDGPARVWNNGIQYYMQHDKLHRIDGPAIIGTSKSPQYYINGIQTTKEGMELYVSLLKLKGLV